MTKKLAIIGGVGLSGILALAWWWANLKMDNSPVAVRRHTIESIVNVHGSPETGLKVCGKAFHRIKGGPPYYSAVPNSPLIVFAYEQSAGAKSLVVCNTNDCTFREVSLEGIRFGERIGYWSATTGKMGDTVEVGESNQIILVSKSFSYSERSLLDLRNNTIRVLELDRNENAIIPTLPTNIWNQSQK